MMETVKKIKFYTYDCMAGEEDEHGHPLECLPFECEISMCPIKQLISIIQSLESTVKRDEND